MALLDDLASKAKTKNSRILLPESTDSKSHRGAKSITDQNLAQIVLFDEDAASSLGVESINLKKRRFEGSNMRKHYLSLENIKVSPLNLH